MVSNIGGTQRVVSTMPTLPKPTAGAGLKGPIVGGGKGATAFPSPLAAKAFGSTKGKPAATPFPAVNGKGGLGKDVAKSSTKGKGGTQKLPYDLGKVTKQADEAVKNAVGEQGTAKCLSAPSEDGSLQ